MNYGENAINVDIELEEERICYKVINCYTSPANRLQRHLAFTKRTLLNNTTSNKSH